MFVEICMFLIKGLNNFSYIYNTSINLIKKCKKYTFNLISTDKVFYLNNLKGDGSKLNEYLKILIIESKELMENDYYSVDSAMQEVWNKHYCSIVKINIDIQKLRTTFWEEGFNILDEFNEKILNKYKEIE